MMMMTRMGVVRHGKDLAPAKLVHVAATLQQWLWIPLELETPWA